MSNLINKLVTSEKEAKDFGFYWPDFTSVIAQVRSECDEVEELVTELPIDNTRLKEEVGDLMHAIFSLCIYCNLDPESTLADALAKFELRFELTKEFAKQAGHQNLHGKSMDEMLQYWHQAKKQLGAK